MYIILFNIILINFLRYLHNINFINSECIQIIKYIYLIFINYISQYKIFNNFIKYINIYNNNEIIKCNN